MAIKKVTYKEPSSYFNEDMKKAAREWDKEHKQSQSKTNSTTKKKSK